MACVSHLPHVLANLLAAQAAGTLEGPGEDAERLPAVGPSFRDAIRVAGANTAIWTDIYTSNADALIAAIVELEGRLRDVRGMLSAADVTALGTWNEGARATATRCSARGWRAAPRTSCACTCRTGPGSSPRSRSPSARPA